MGMNKYILSALFGAVIGTGTSCTDSLDCP